MELAEPGMEIIPGIIGSGKSRLVEFKIIQSLYADRPCCLLDPKFQTFWEVWKLLRTTPEGLKLWDRVKDRLILMDPVALSNYVVGFNAIAPLPPFEHMRPDLVALLSNSLMSFIRRQSGFDVSEANRMQNIMSAAIGLLVDGGKGKLSLAEMPYLFEVGDKSKSSDGFNPFTRRLLSQATHYGTISFWKDQWASWNANAKKEWPQSTLGRIFQYRFDDRLLMTTCAVDHSKLDFKAIVEDGYWLFVNLPFQLMSDTATTLIGNLILSKLFYACMQRRDISRPFRVYVEESRFFNTGPLDMILETARGYNMWLTLVVQSFDQLCRATDGRVDYRLKETALNNCRYFSVFQDSADAETLARLMYPLTGQVIIGTRNSGDYEYLNTAAEKDLNERRFMNLGFREFIPWDKLTHPQPHVFITPDVEVPQGKDEEAQALEAEHLKKWGFPAEEIKQEIDDRRRKCMGELNTEKEGRAAAPRKIETPLFHSVNQNDKPAPTQRS